MNGSADLMHITFKCQHTNSFPQLKLLVTNTAVPRQTSVLVAGVRSLKERYPTIIDPILDSIEAITTKAIEFLQNYHSKDNTTGNPHFTLAHGWKKK